MFRKFLTQATNIANNLVSGAQTSRVDTFRKQWADLNAFYTHDAGDESPVRETSLPWRLEQMLNMLVEEERDGEGESVGEGGTDAAGPCLEEFINERMLGQLYSLAKGNYPHGMHALVLEFTASLLSHMRANLLPHVAIHKPINKLIRVTLASPDARFFGSFVKLLNALAGVLVRTPSMLPFMVKEVGGGSGDDGDDGDGAYVMPLLQGLTYTMNYEVGLSEAKRESAEMSRSSVLSLLTIRSVLVSSAFLAAKVPESLARCLASLFAAAIASSGAAASEAFRSQAEFAANVVSLGAPSLGRAIAEALTAEFLGPVLGPALSTSIDKDATAAMELTAELIAGLNHPLLAGTVATFLFGPDSTLGVLCIERIESVSDEVALAALDMFVALLETYSGEALEHLAVAPLRSAAGVLPPPLTAMGGAASHAALEAFMALAVVHNPSPQPRLDYDGYLLDAHARLSKCLAVTAKAHELGLGTPSSSAPAAAAASAEPAAAEAEKSSSAVFSPGLFITVLFRRLEEALDTPLAINLAVTHVVSLLCVYPSSLVHAFLLNAAPNPPVTTLYAVLRRLSGEIAGRVRRIKDFDTQLEAAKRSLGMGDSKGQGDESRRLDELESFRHKNLLHAVLLLEEFCKDLAAIILAKAPLAPPLPLPPSDDLANLAALAEADGAEEAAESPGMPY